MGKEAEEIYDLRETLEETNSELDKIKQELRAISGEL